MKPTVMKPTVEIKYGECKAITVRKDKGEFVYTAHYVLNDGFRTTLRIPEVDGKSENTKQLVMNALQEQNLSAFDTEFAVLRTNTAYIVAPVYKDGANWCICNGYRFKQQLHKLITFAQSMHDEFLYTEK